jgi:uncharacterized protein (DUF2249 family)
MITLSQSGTKMNAEFETLDLGPLQPVERHKKIFQKWEALQPGEVLRIVKIRVRRARL